MPEIHTTPVPIVTSSFVSASSVLANITGLSQNVITGRKYIFESALWISAPSIAGTKFAVSGTAVAYASSVLYNLSFINEATNADIINARHSILGGSTGQDGTTAGFCMIKGMIYTSVAGTLTTQFAQNVQIPSSVATVLPGSYFNVELIT